MKFFTALFALPLIGSIIASPIPSIKEDKRLLGLDLDLGLGGVTGSLNLVGLIDKLSADLAPPLDALIGDLGLDDIVTVQGELDTVKSLLQTVDDSLAKLSTGDVSGTADEVATELSTLLETVETTLNGLPDSLTDVPAVGELVTSIQPLLTSLVDTLNGLVPGLLDALGGLLKGVTGEVGGLLDGVLGGLGL